MQTTAVDQASGNGQSDHHASHVGQRIASDRPAVAVAEVANPQRMGTALTYARRYALFTLVGIAGEDDLDCPGHCGLSVVASAWHSTSGAGRPRSSEQSCLRAIPANGRAIAIKQSRSAVLVPEQSETLRLRLLTEVGEFCRLPRMASDIGAYSYSRTRTASHPRTMRKPWEEAFEQSWANSRWCACSTWGVVAAYQPRLR